MCNLYAPVPPEKVAMQFAVAAPPDSYGPVVVPLKPGPIVLSGGSSLVAQWGLIPPGSRARVPTLHDGRRLSTNNARRERLDSAPSFRDAWRAGRRCIIPALHFDEPYWGRGKNIWWRFWRADGQAWALAGIWSEWTDPMSGKVVPSYSMITQNCDGHSLLAQMHKPDPRLPIDQQDKRAVVPLEASVWDQWLHGSPEQADALIQLPPATLFRHGPAEENQTNQGSLF